MTVDRLFANSEPSCVNRWRSTTHDVQFGLGLYLVIRVRLRATMSNHTWGDPVFSIPCHELPWMSPQYNVDQCCPALCAVSRTHVHPSAHNVLNQICLERSIRARLVSRVVGRIRGITKQCLIFRSSSRLSRFHNLSLRDGVWSHGFTSNLQG